MFYHLRKLRHAHRRAHDIAYTAAHSDRQIVLLPNPASASRQFADASKQDVGGRPAYTVPWPGGAFLRIKNRAPKPANRPMPDKPPVRHASDDPPDR